jgi:hypothetical protein
MAQMRKSRRSKSSSSARRSVRTEMRQMRSGKHKMKSRKQAVAIGIGKTRAKGAKIPKKRAR